MGVTTVSQMHFDLQSLINLTVDLDALVAPFTKEEIDQVERQMPIDKPPGPDGFNGFFMKKC